MKKNNYYLKTSVRGCLTELKHKFKGGMKRNKKKLTLLLRYIQSILMDMFILKVMIMM